MCFRRLQYANDFASVVIHTGFLSTNTLKRRKTNLEELSSNIGKAQDLCREAILPILSASGPDWSDVVLGNGFRRGSQGVVGGVTQDP